MRDEFEKILGDALRDAEAQAPDLFDAIAARRTPLHKFRNKLWLNRYRLMGAAALIVAALTWFLMSEGDHTDQNGLVDSPVPQENVQGVAPEKGFDASGAFDEQRDFTETTEEVDTHIDDQTDADPVGSAEAREFVSSSDGQIDTQQDQVIAEVDAPDSPTNDDISSDQVFDEEIDQTISEESAPIVSDDNEAQEAEDQEDATEVDEAEIEEAPSESETFNSNNKDVESAQGAEGEGSSKDIVSDENAPEMEDQEVDASEEIVEATDDSDNNGSDIELPTPPIRHFSMQLEAGPMIGNRILNGDRSIIDQRNAAETAQWSTVAGLKFNYELNTNLEVFAGFTYTERKERMQHKQVETITEQVTKTVDVVVIDPVEGERIEQVQVTSLEDRDVVTETQSDNSYERVVLPVGLRYNFFIKRSWNISPSVETAVQLWNRNSGLVLGANGETIALSSPAFSRTSVQARIGTAVGYRFNGRNSLFIEPGYSTFINPVNSAKYPLKQRDFAIDFRIGWKVNF